MKSFRLVLFVHATLPALLAVSLQAWGMPAETDDIFGDGEKSQVKPRKQVFRFADTGSKENGRDRSGRAEWRIKSEEPAGTAEVRAFLNRKIVIEAEELRLDEFLEALSKLGGIQVVLDRPTLEALNVTGENLITLDASKMTAGAALRHVMRRLDHDVVAVPGDRILTLTTREAESERHLRQDVYDVRAVIKERSSPKPIRHVWANTDSQDKKSTENLADLIRGIEQPASWSMAGGHGELKMIGPGLLAVTHTSAMQERVQLLLEALHAVGEGRKDRKKGASQPRSVATDTDQEFAERLDKALPQPVRLKFEETQLADGLAFLTRIAGLPIKLDQNAVEAINITDENLVTIQAENVSLRSALEIMLRNLDARLTWSAFDEALWITTRGASQENRSTVVYPLLDLIEPAAAAGFPPLDPEEIVETITAAVEPESWDERGGPGTMRFYPPCGALVVCQTDDVHQKLSALLDKMRKRRQGPKGAGPEWKESVKDGAGKIADLPASEEIVVIYHLGILGPRPFGVPVANTVPTQPDLNELKKSIVESTGSNRWPEKTTSIRCVGNQLIIRQTEAVHEKIERLLSELLVLGLDPSANFGGSFDFVPSQVAPGGTSGK